jgi:hypothetical protein
MADVYRTGLRVTFEQAFIASDSVPSRSDEDAHVALQAAEAHDRVIHKAGSRTGSARVEVSSTQKERFSVMKAELLNSEISTDSFMAAAKQRSELLSTLTQVMNSLIIILAVNHSRFIDRNSSMIAVFTVLTGFTFVYTHLRYLVAHLANIAGLARREIARQEDALQTRSSDVPVDPAVQIRRDLDAARRRGIIMQMQVRLGSTELVASVLAQMSSYGYTYVIYLLLRVVTTSIDFNFSDGIWAPHNVVMFILLTVPLMVEFLIDSYHQTPEEGPF